MSKLWTLALVGALAAAPVSSVLAAGPGSEPAGENGKAGTAAANANTPAAKEDPGGVRTPDTNKSSDESRAAKSDTK